MKKSLTLAMALALGVSASAYAANPFSDVPVGHWAYDGVAQLAADGVVEGFANGEFGGDKLLTRYEMAQIVAKAMAKGANCDKLVAEFADELDSLGVRVAKLEKDADAVKITGEVRYHYADYKAKVLGKSSSIHENELRSRLWVQGTINENWTYTGMLQNTQNFTNNAGEEDTKFKRAYVEGKIGGVDVLAGRYNAYLVNGNLYDEHADGIELSYGKDVKVTAFYMKPTEQYGYTGFGYLPDANNYPTALGVLEYGNAYGMKVDARIGVLNTNIGYTVFNNGIHNVYSLVDGTLIGDYSVNQKDNQIWNVGVSFDVVSNLVLTADYMKSNINKIELGRLEDGDLGYDCDDGIIIGLNYKGAQISEPGSYGVYTKYYNQAKNTVITHTMNGEYAAYGFEGYMIGADYTLAKNVVASIEWYDLKTKSVDYLSVNGPAILPKMDLETIWAQVVYTF